MGYASELAARRKRENAEALAKAIDEAARVGKEAFDLARLEALLGRGSQLRREDELRESYFISHPEMRTLAEYAEHLLAIEPWEAPSLEASGLARTVEEMHFAARLSPCPRCGRHVGPLTLEGSGTRWFCRGMCIGCGAERTFHFRTVGDPWATTIDLCELGPGVSNLISREQFLRVMQENAVGIPDDPKSLTDPEREAVAARLATALVAGGELLKMLPPSTQPQLPELDRATISTEFKRLFKLSARHAPVNAISLSALEAHRDWIQRGAKGDDGYLLIEDKSLVGQRYGSYDLSFVRIARSDLTRVDMSLSRLNEADLEEVVFTGANLGGTSFANAFIRGGSWTKASMWTANFNGVEARGTDFSRSELERSTWLDAKVTAARFDGVHFGSAQLGGATFTGCSFRGASFESTTPSALGAELVDCDLTGTIWTGRDATHATYEISRRPSGLTADAIVATLIEPKAPPSTVGQLLDAVGIALGADTLGVNASGTIVTPRAALSHEPRIAVRYAFEPTNEAPLGSLHALLERRVLFFALFCPTKDPIQAALRSRFGLPVRARGLNGDDFLVYGTWVYTTQSCLLAWYLALPDWLRAPRDWHAREPALRSLAETLRAAVEVDDLVAACASVASEAGASVRRTEHGGDVTFDPPIVADELATAFGWESCVAHRSGMTWELGRMSSRDEDGPTQPLSNGSWAVVPRLADHPIGGFDRSEEVHFPHRTDVVVSMRVEPSRERRLVALVHRGPPHTVGELLSALGVAIARDDATMSLGRVVLPDLSARYAFDIHHEPPATLDSVHARKLLEWTVFVGTGLRAIEAALRSRFGAPREVGRARAYDRWVLRSDPAANTGTLSHYPVRLPDDVVSGPDPGARKRALRELASAIATTSDPARLSSLVAAIPPETGVVHRDGASRGVVELELVPAITATELADIFAWPQAVGITTSVHQDSWIIGLAAGEQGHLTITTPRWGPWRLTASLDGRPRGATIGRYGPAPVLSLGTEDVVRWLRIGD